MANRPIFIPFFTQDHLVKEINFEFKWNSGFAPVQKKKNIAALHESAKNFGFTPLLEVSSKSEILLGQRLSAFNLKIETEIGKISVESAFQGSKVFEKGGPYTDLYMKTPKEAKTDHRLKSSGKLVEFDFMGSKWPIIPKTSFYDWLYIKSLYPHRDYLKKLFKYKGFTDIEFNPKKSINCQARTCALLLSLIDLNLLEEAMKSKSKFIKIVSKDSLRKKHSEDLQQLNLIKQGATSLCASELGVRQKQTRIAL